MKMNIVCVALHAPPLNDPESFCTARFLSALCQQGHSVDLITLDHEKQLDSDIVNQLLNPAINIIKIRHKEIGKRDRCMSSITNQYWGQHGEFINCAYDESVRVLRSRINPILVTRAYPVASNIIGYKLKQKLGITWIAHFSDPYPGFGMYSRRNMHTKYIDSWWARRILRNADVISVTCENALRWFKDYHNTDVKVKWTVTDHIGDPPLRVSGGIIGDHSDLVFAHVGRLHRKRYVDAIIGEFSDFYEIKGPAFRLLQFGPVDVGDIYKNTEERQLPVWFEVLSGQVNSPTDATSVLDEADVNVVVDQDDGIASCPYLASKFAYAVIAGKPILAIGQKDSAMAQMCAEYKCFYFADGRKSGDISRVLGEIVNAPSKARLIPSNQLKDKFMQQGVAQEFIEAVERIADLQTC